MQLFQVPWNFVGYDEAAIKATASAVLGLYNITMPEKIQVIERLLKTFKLTAEKFNTGAALNDSQLYTVVYCYIRSRLPHLESQEGRRISGALVFDKQGTGKTRSLLCVLVLLMDDMDDKEAEKGCLILTPKPAVSCSWKNEASIMFKERDMVYVSDDHSGLGAAFRKPDGCKIVACPYIHFARMNKTMRTSVETGRTPLVVQVRIYSTQ